MASLRSATHNVSTLVRLNWRDRWLLIQALCLLLMMRPGLRLFGLKRMQVTLARIPGAKHDRRFDSAEAQRAAYWVEVATRHALYKPNCLERSLTLRTLLCRRGIENALCIGVRKEAGQFAAHAWIESQGVVLNDRPDIRQQYTLLTDRIPLKFQSSFR